jgi:hypothetical protein
MSMLPVGAKRLEQLNDNLSAVELTLTSDEIQKLDNISGLPPEYQISRGMLPVQEADRTDPSKARFGRR